MRKYPGTGDGSDVHRVMAEKAYGGPLPKGAEVHHVDRNRYNNAPGNLVLCPSRTYHHLLHVRQEAFDSCGHYDWRKCPYCGKFDSPNNLTLLNIRDQCVPRAYHAACYAAYKRTYRAKKDSKWI